MNAVTGSSDALAIKSKYSRCFWRKISFRIPSADNNVTNSAFSFPNEYGFEYARTDNVLSVLPVNLRIDDRKYTLFSMLGRGFTMRTPLYPRYRICMTLGIYRDPRKMIFLSRAMV